MFGNLLGSVASSMLGGDNQTKALQLIQALLQSQGGVQGLIEKFQQGGLEQLVKSWIGTGENQPISIAQILAIFGQSNIEQAAEAVQVEKQDAPNLLAEYLPKIVDSLSPNGELDLKNLDTNALLQQGAKAVLGKLLG